MNPEQLELFIHCAAYEFLLTYFLVMTGLLDIEKGFCLPRWILRKYRGLSLDLRLWLFTTQNKIKATFYNWLES